jgi:hypothetical protein
MKFVIISISLLVLILYIGLKEEIFPFERHALISFLGFSGGISFLFMVLSLLLFGDNLGARAFALYAWVAIPLSLIFLTIVTAFFVSILFIILYKDISLSSG